MKNIGLLFDMDGVIVDNHIYHFKAWQILSENYKINLEAEDYRLNINGRTLNEVVRHIVKDDISEEEIKKIGSEKEAIYREIYQPFLSPTTGLIKFLGDASDAGIPMIVGTSAPAVNVHFTLEGLGISHYFKAVLDERAVTKGKPDPEIYLKCADELGLANDRCIVLEDAVAGIKAGKAAGSKVIGLATSHAADELEADVVVTDFNELDLNLVKSLIDQK